MRTLARHLALRKVGGIAVTVTMALLLSGCLTTSGHPKRANGNVIDGPDPAAVRTGPTTGQIYTTQTMGKHIQTWGWNFSTHTQVGGYGDALPTLPSWADGANIWAPTVRNFDGLYVMFFSASSKTGNLPHDHDNNCLGAAYSTSVSGPFTPVVGGDFGPWCPATDDVEFLDPQLFSDPATGKNWLYFSRQYTPNLNDATPTGDIDAVQVNADALAKVGGVYTIETYADIANNVGLCSDHGGPNPRLENPSMVYDGDVGTYTLLMSFGSFQHSCYETVQVTCSAANSGCNSSSGYSSVINLKGDTTLTGTGGASMLFDNGSDGNYIIYAGYVGAPGGTRVPYSDSTSCYVEEPGTSNIMSC